MTREDIALANRTAHEILGRTTDEMPPQTRKLLLLIRQWSVNGQQRSNCKPARYASRAGRSRLHTVERQPVEGPLYAPCGNGIPADPRRQPGHLLQYELLWDGSGDGSHLCGLIEPEDNQVHDSRQVGAGRGQVALKLPSCWGLSWGGETACKPCHYWL